MKRILFVLFVVVMVAVVIGLTTLASEPADDLAIKAYREGKIPFPDGAIIAALHWNEVSSEDNNQVFAKGFPVPASNLLFPARA
jgi:hypothetical protein